MNAFLARQLRISGGFQRNIHIFQRPPKASSLLKLSQSPHSISRSRFLIARSVASSVSSKPASQSFDQAALNVKEELGNSAGDLAKLIAAANPRGSDIPGNGSPAAADFLGITRSIASQVPKPVMWFGLAGALPYLGTAGTSVWLANQASLAAAGLTAIDPGVAITVLHQALETQVTYGAVMLSFLGALHWGMEFAKFGGEKGVARLALGTAPVLYGWGTVMLLNPVGALIAQWVGFTGLWYADAKVTTAGWTPKWYSQYRFYLSILVGTCIIGTLAGTSAFGPVAGNNLTSHDLDAIRAERSKDRPNKQLGAIYAGDLEAVPADEMSDHYGIIHEKEHKEEKEEKEGEKE
ncbi:hypothetical protein DL96DRAFT_1505544 [Flagelloscypha sp. PMI_526]|nr:hypothetical protein DL96DRAFT_1505544 [Flagelloscypha sp. PMI_526]